MSNSPIGAPAAGRSRSLLYDHGRNCSCTDGLLSTGYIEAILNGGCWRFDDISILDVIPYCTAVFLHKVDEAHERHANLTPMLALANELDLDAFAATKECHLHGVVDVAQAVELFNSRHDDSLRTSAMIVRCTDAHGKLHHFAFVWTRASRLPGDTD